MNDYYMQTERMGFLEARSPQLFVLIQHTFHAAMLVRDWRGAAQMAKEALEIVTTRVSPGTEEALTAASAAWLNAEHAQEFGRLNDPFDIDASPEIEDLADIVAVAEGSTQADLDSYKEWLGATRALLAFEHKCAVAWKANGGDPVQLLTEAAA